MLNHVELMGRLTQHPERRNSETTTIIRFALACQRSHTSKNGMRGTDFFEVVCFGKLGDFAENFFSRGQLVVIEGRLTQRQWTDTDGNKRQFVEVIAERLHFAERKLNEPERKEREITDGYPLPPNDQYGAFEDDAELADYQNA